MSGDFKPPGFLRWGHLQTTLPSLFRKCPLVTDVRERITTPDGDFLDLDWRWSDAGAPWVVLTHGLEGHSRQAYIQGMAGAFEERGWNVLAWNLRGCSGEANRLLRTYHSGATDDLQVVLDRLFKETAVTGAALVGFSLGGNLTLKYLGEAGGAVDSRIRACVAISVPCDLEDSCRQLERLENRLYMARFMRTLRRKMDAKARQFPGRLNLDGLNQMRTFGEFDEAFTAPLHGFSGALDYWTRCSAKQFLARIRVPTLLINARNDPFLGTACFPGPAAVGDAPIHLEYPESGGHVGFVDRVLPFRFWSEARAVGFCSKQLA